MYTERRSHAQRQWYSYGTAEVKATEWWKPFAFAFVRNKLTYLLTYLLTYQALQIFKFVFMFNHRNVTSFSIIEI